MIVLTAVSQQELPEQYSQMEEECYNVLMEDPMSISAPSALRNLRRCLLGEVLTKEL